MHLALYLMSIHRVTGKPGVVPAGLLADAGGVSPTNPLTFWRRRA